MILIFLSGTLGKNITFLDFEDEDGACADDKLNTFVFNDVAQMGKKREALRKCAALGTPPLKYLITSDRTYWNHILGFRVWAFLSSK